MKIVVLAFNLLLLLLADMGLVDKQIIYLPQKNLMELVGIVVAI